MDKKKKGQKTITMNIEDLYHLHDSLKKMRTLNLELLNMMDGVLEHNARLARALKDAYPYIEKRDRAAFVADLLLGGNIGEPQLVKEKAT